MPTACAKQLVEQDWLLLVKQVHLHANIFKEPKILFPCFFICHCSIYIWCFIFMFFCQIPIPSYVNSIKNRGQGILDGEPTFSGDACDCVCKCNWLRGYVKGKTHAQNKHINNFPTTSSASTNTWNKRKTMTNKQFVGHDVGTCILDSMRIRPAHRLH